MPNGNKETTDLHGRLLQVLKPQVSQQGRQAALRVIIAFVSACVVWSTIEDVWMWQLGLPNLNESTVRVIHDALRVTLLGIVAWRGTLYGIARLEEAKRELDKADLDTVLRFARAADLMEKYRGGHNLRVGLYSREIANQLGLDERLSNEIMQTSMLHDIGEIGLPDALRLKPEPLTAFERLRMMRHVEVGADLLVSDRRLLSMAYRIIRHHHENWDGSGYPDGLKEEDIPIEARIVAVADVFDALVSDRPHRHAFSVSFALDELKALSGKRFDPKVVEAFLGAEERVRWIHTNSADPQVAEQTRETMLNYGVMNDGSPDGTRTRDLLLEREAS